MMLPRDLSDANYGVDLWIQWWSNDTSSSSSRHSTGYWIGLYAGLQCIPLLLLGLWLW